MREILRITENLVPAIKHDSFVVRMANPTTYIDLRVASHDSPVPATPFALRKSPIMLGCETVWCARADINRLPAKATKLFTDIGLASSTCDRFIPQNKQQFHSDLRRWYEKPFTLANARCVASPITILRPDSALTALHKIWLESLF